MSEFHKMAELYQGKAKGEPLLTVLGSEARVLRKAARLAAELGQSVEVVISGAAEVVCVSAAGAISYRPIGGRRG